jgi:hypothetical protein
MVYLLNMVIFHGYVSHNQRIYNQMQKICICHAICWGDTS